MTHSPLKRRAARLGIVLGLTIFWALALTLILQEASETHATQVSPQTSGKASQPQSPLAATLLVATSADYPPMEYISGTQIVGYDIDLMDALATEMSTTVVYTNVAFTDILTSLVDGKYDAAIATLSVIPEHEAIVDFTLPYLNIDDEPIAIAVQQGDDSLRRQINTALRQLRADGTLDTLVADITADKPEWQVRLPDWPYIFLPLVLRGFE
jgi:ABC-type amino acid transport substrate-binding protein